MAGSTKGKWSLRKMCIREVLQHSKLTEIAFSFLPFDLNQDILSSAIRSHRVTSLRNVLKWWPLRVLILRGNDDCGTEDSSLVEAISHYITERQQTDMIRLIDIRERKIGFDGSTVLCKAIISANKNCTRHESQVESSRGMLPSAYDSYSVLKDGSCLTIYSDLFVNYSNPEVVLEALKSSNSSVQLWISAFCVVEVGDNRLCQFLHLLDPSHLRNLDFSFNGLAYYDNVSIELPKVWLEMQKFVGLRALSLSHNNLGESQLRKLCMIMRQFSSLVSLDLAGNYVGSSVKLLVNSLVQPLNHLKLGQCRIRNVGIRYLAHSKQSLKLKELDLSLNCLSSECFDDLIFMLESSKDTIERLDISGNQIPLNSEQLLAQLSQLHDLKALTVSPSSDHVAAMMDRLRKSLPNLQVKVDLCYV